MQEPLKPCHKWIHCNLTKIAGCFPSQYWDTADTAWEVIQGEGDVWRHKLSTNRLHCLHLDSLVPKFSDKIPLTRLSFGVSKWPHIPSVQANTLVHHPEHLTYTFHLCIYIISSIWLQCIFQAKVVVPPCPTFLALWSNCRVQELDFLSNDFETEDVGRDHTSCAPVLNGHST